MNNLIKQLEKNNYPIWIENNKNVLFANDSLKDMFKIKYQNQDNINNYILQHKEDLNDLYQIIHEKSNITLDGTAYSKVLVPTGDGKDLMAILVETFSSKECKSISCMFNMLIDSIPEIIFVKDINKKYTIINKECKNFYNARGVYEIIGKTDLEFPLDQEFLQTCTKHDDIVLNTKQPLYIEEVVPKVDGSGLLTYQTIKTPIIDKDGNLHGLVGSVRDISQIKDIERKLMYLSYRDSLTGLYNRTFFDEKIQEISNKEDFNIGVVIGDVNGLKIVNDAFGHIEGDKFLKKIANILTDTCNDKGLVFRWGGDEFITLLFNANENDCKKYIEDINIACEKANYEHFQLSISQGYSVFSKGCNIDKIIGEAEIKVYQRKILTSKSIKNTTLYSLKENLHNKKIETKEHLNRVLNMCMRLGKEMKLNDVELEKLSLLALMHDIGKVGVSDEVLLKMDKLTDEEYEQVKLHSEIGYRLAMILPEVSHISREILTHHEKWDGSGYPLGLKEEEIPLLSRIISVVDAFDTMINTIYKSKLTKEGAIQELISNSSTQFDPNIVELFCRVFNK